MKKEHAIRCGAAVLGTALLVSVGSGVAAAEGDDSGIDVNVDIAPAEGPGILAMTVAGESAELAEEGSTALERMFVGTLPEVRVTDTRASGAQWYVTGSAGDFTTSDGENSIGGEHLGWSPRLIDDDAEGIVEVGADVDSELEGGAGLTDGFDLLYSVWDAESAREDGQGEWKATADLSLKVPVDVEPGAYSGTVTLSLFDE